jgi:hypothetical protein
VLEGLAEELAEETGLTVSECLRELRADLGSQALLVQQQTGDDDIVADATPAEGAQVSTTVTAAPLTPRTPLSVGLRNSPVTVAR